jgi:hypothetical protein
VLRLAISLTVALALLSSIGVISAPAQQAYSGYGHSQFSKTGFAEARFGYVWGLNEIRLRDGDNALIPPSKREIDLQGILFGAAAAKFVTDDLGIRIQGWIDVPTQMRNDFYMDRTVASWDTRARYIVADLSFIYSIGPQNMPLTTGLMAGYRYNDFDYDSRTVGQPAGTFHDHLQIHVPYMGVYYANAGMLNSLVRLDVLYAPIIMCRLDSNEQRSSVVTQITGQAVTGQFFETFFSWSWPLSDSTLIGVFGNYTYMDLSGGATVVQGGRSSTRFSMDCPYNIGSTGLTLTYTF